MNSSVVVIFNVSARISVLAEKRRCERVRLGREQTAADRLSNSPRVVARGIDRESVDGSGSGNFEVKGGALFCLKYSLMGPFEDEVVIAAISRANSALRFFCAGPMSACVDMLLDMAGPSGPC